MIIQRQRAEQRRKDDTKVNDTSVAANDRVEFFAGRPTDATAGDLRSTLTSAATAAILIAKMASQKENGQIIIQAGPKRIR